MSDGVIRIVNSDEAATLRGLLTRLSGDAALSYSGQSASTPPAHPTPRACSVDDCDSDRPQPIANHGEVPESVISPAWMARPYWVDPPSGWRYGFPRLYDPAADGNMTEWMVANGYPQHLADKNLPCTFTAATDSELD